MHAVKSSETLNELKPGNSSGGITAKQAIKNLMEPYIMRLEAYDIPDEKVQRVIDYAVDLFAKFHNPKKVKPMSHDRMLGKVVARFKLKLKSETDKVTEMVQENEGDVQCEFCHEYYFANEGHDENYCSRDCFVQAKKEENE